MLQLINRTKLVKVQDKFMLLKFSYFRYSISMMLDDTRGGFDASSLHRDTSMDISLYKKFGLLSCHRDTSSNSRYKRKTDNF